MKRHNTLDVVQARVGLEKVVRYINANGDIPGNQFSIGAVHFVENTQTNIWFSTSRPNCIKIFFDYDEMSLNLVVINDQGIDDEVEDYEKIIKTGVTQRKWKKNNIDLGFEPSDCEEPDDVVAHDLKLLENQIKVLNDKVIKANQFVERATPSITIIGLSLNHDDNLCYNFESKAISLDIELTPLPYAESLQVNVSGKVLRNNDDIKLEASTDIPLTDFNSSITKIDAYVKELFAKKKVNIEQAQKIASQNAAKFRYDFNNEGKRTQRAASIVKPDEFIKELNALVRKYQVKVK